MYASSDQDQTKIHSVVRHNALGNQKFMPLPQPTGSPPYHINLADVLGSDAVKKMADSGAISFHAAGDTGGIRYPVPQQIVETAMESDFQGQSRPAFFYHLGDVVYYFGEAREYYPQFYEPYTSYPAPIFAIPGNHDGDVPFGSPVPSLDAFVRNFCAAKPVVVPDSVEVNRPAMTQPNVYFTLEAPFVTMIGLYSNVPEGGQFEDAQLRWLKDELRQAPRDKAVIVSVHHPAYSADMHHSGSKVVKDALDSAFSESGRVADMVLTGHVHNYQRFTKTSADRDVPYIVAGAGGYWHLHYMQKQPNGDPLPTPYNMPDSNAVLESYCENRHGYLIIQVTPDAIYGTYYTVPRPHESWRNKAQAFDSFVLDLGTHRMKKA